MKTELFDYALPPELIAQKPAARRDASRLMVIHRAAGRWEHLTFSELPRALRAGDLLVRNNSRVVPARLVGLRCETGGRWEGLFLKAGPDGTWEVLATTRGRPIPGEKVRTHTGLEFTLLERGTEGRWTVRPTLEEPPHALLERYGSMPLPPYIRKGQEQAGDRERYQTVYGRAPGSVAAPTAGLHFTDELFEALGRAGIEHCDVTLHVGIGTFRPIEANDITEHVLHAEAAEVSMETAERLHRQRAAGGRVIAVGTTAARTLETSARSGRYEPFEGETALYIRPGHQFRGIDGLITNFHLPRSSLLVLVSALAGVELMREAYAEAVRERYRFFSYGDAMAILP